jgi:hypothetical protein
MLRIDSGGLTDHLNLGVQRRAAREAGHEVSANELRDGLRVSISALGQTRATAKNDDIEQSDLPGSVKEMLKLIRALRQQIVEKKAELEALLSQPGLDAQARQTQVEVLQSELAALQGALSSASASLIKAMREAGLSSEQMQAAGRLAMA